MKLGSENWSTKSKSTRGRQHGPSRIWRQFFSTGVKQYEQTPGQLDPESAANAAQIIKRTDAYMGSTDPAKSVNIKPSTTIPPTMHSIEIVSDSSSRKGSSPVHGIKEQKADAWENSEMARIESRYEKIISTILSWEEVKRKIARHRLYKIEGELEGKRARNLKHYHKDISMINQVASRARASTEQKRLNEESKAKEKAKKIRSTGKLPTTCFCF